MAEISPSSAFDDDFYKAADEFFRASYTTGIWAWDVTSPMDLTVACLARALADLKPQSVLLLGTGVTQVFPGPELTRAFAEAQIGLEPMSTGAAARTYNVLLAEKRAIAAALIAVE